MQNASIDNSDLPYTINGASVQLDELDELMFNPDGTCCTNDLILHSKAIASTFGEFSNIKLGADSRTTVKFRVITNLDGRQVANTRGQDDAFYDGWFAAVKKLSILNAELNLASMADAAEYRSWAKGYITGCNHLFRQLEEQIESRLSIAYALGVLKAYHQMSIEGLEEWDETSFEQRKVELGDAYKAAYFDTNQVCTKLWKGQLPDIF